MPGITIDNFFLYHELGFGVHKQGASYRLSKDTRKKSSALHSHTMARLSSPPVKTTLAAFGDKKTLRAKPKYIFQIFLQKKTLFF